MICDGCGKNYCIRHRLGPDHNCTVSTTTTATNVIKCVTINQYMYTMVLGMSTLTLGLLGGV